jgi:hypothetical protein
VVRHRTDTTLPRDGQLYAKIIALGRAIDEDSKHHLNSYESDKGTLMMEVGPQLPNKEKKSCLKARIGRAIALWKMELELDEPLMQHFAGREEEKEENAENLVKRKTKLEQNLKVQEEMKEMEELEQRVSENQGVACMS